MFGPWPGWLTGSNDEQKRGPQMEQVHLGTQDGNDTTKVKSVVGPFTLRDTVVVVGAALVLVGSLVPISWTKALSVNMWIFPGLPFHLLVTLLMPLGVGVAFAWRRFTKRTRVRVGSLSLDQFGSIISLISTAYFFNSYVATMAPAFLLGFVGALAMVCGTTLARYFGAFRPDFVPGDEAVISNDVRPVAVSASKAASAAATATASAADDSEGFGASSDPKAGPSKPVVPKTAGTQVRESSADARPVNAAAPAGVTVGAAAAATLAGTAAAAQATSAEPAKSVIDEPVAAEPEAEVPGASAVAAPAAAAAKQESTGTGESADTPATSDEPAAQDEPAAKSEAAPSAFEKIVNEAVNEAANEPAAASKVAVPETNDPAESDFPEVSLVQQGAEAEPAPAATGLIPAAAPDLAREQAPQAASRASHAEPATSAHPVAPAAPQATAALSRDELAAQMKAAAASQLARDDEPFGARSDVAAEEPESSSFWFALNQPRPVFDPTSGARITTLQPGVWILCLEDRGQDYLVNLDGDRPAVLRELDNLQFPEK